VSKPGVELVWKLDGRPLHVCQHASALGAGTRTRRRCIRRLIPVVAWYRIMELPERWLSAVGGAVLSERSQAHLRRCWWWIGCQPGLSALERMRSRVRASLRLAGGDLDPDGVTRLLGVSRLRCMCREETSRAACPVPAWSLDALDSGALLESAELGCCALSCPTESLV
jgi:hypothetical protein